MKAPPLRIGMIGTGAVGAALGGRLAALGHDVRFGARPGVAPDGLRRVGPVCAPAEAAAGADLVVLAVPWRAMEEAVEAIAHRLTDGMILVDPSNPIAADFTAADCTPDRSAGERAQRLAPGARVVKAFNTISAAVMEDPVFPGGAPALPVAGDDLEAKAVVMGLAQALGFAPYDAGPLAAARLIEALAWHAIQLAMWSRKDVAFALLQR